MKLHRVLTSLLSVLFAANALAQAQETTAPATGNLSQIAQLDFRWLDATPEAQRGAQDYQPNPIIAWVIPNHLDQSLTFFDASGNALGSVQTTEDQPGSRNTRWGWPLRSGIPKDTPPSDRIKNVALLQLIEGLLPDADGVQITPKLFRAIYEKQTGAEIEGSPNLAVLLGATMVLVRAEVSLAFLDLTTTAEIPERFRPNVKGQIHSTNVTAPAIATWLEGKESADFIVFKEVAPVTLSSTFPPHRSHVSLLVDSKAGLRATCEGLTSQEITIPADLLAEGLHGIEKNIRSTAPILRQIPEPGIPVPSPDMPTFLFDSP